MLTSASTRCLLSLFTACSFVLSFVSPFAASLTDLPVPACPLLSPCPKYMATAFFISCKGAYFTGSTCTRPNPCCKFPLPATIQVLPSLVASNPPARIICISISSGSASSTFNEMLPVTDLSKMIFMLPILAIERSNSPTSPSCTFRDMASALPLPSSIRHTTILIKNRFIIFPHFSPKILTSAFRLFAACAHSH